MKKLLLFIGVLSSSFPLFAQRTHSVHNTTIGNVINGNFFQHTSLTGFANKTTGVGDTEVLSNIASTDNLVLYYAGSTNADSGFTTGMDAYGDQGYAERYDFNGADSSMKVIGLITSFGGTVNPASTNIANLKVWDIGNSGEQDFGNYYYSGLPNNTLDSVLVPFTQLGIGPSGSDTEKYFAFANPTSNLDEPFYIGYQINYNAANFGGDTIGLYGSEDGDRTSVLYTAVNSTDTVINVQNAVMFNDGNWYDNYFDNFGIQQDFAIYPVVIIGQPTAVNSVTKNSLTFFGNYPDPAVNSTNISFSLAKTADVTVQVMDMNGRLMNKIQQAGLGAGQHIITLSTGSLAAGNYLYVVNTSDGDGIASKFTVVK